MKLFTSLWFRKAAAGLLLLLLSAITVIQVSHSHQSSHSGAAALLKKTPGSVLHQGTGEAKCFICDYQLTRDAEVAPAFIPALQHADYIIAQNNFTSPLIDGCAAFAESRGPPALA